MRWLKKRKMMSNNRDEQFKGFSKLLLKELLGNALDEYGFIVEREHYPDLNHDLNICEDIIAKRAYDLANHIAMHACKLTLDGVAFYYGKNDAVHGIPDMTEWPEENA